MAFDVQFNEAGGYITARVSGEWTEDNLKSGIDALAAEARRLGCSRALLDIRDLSRPKSGYDRFVVGEYIAQVWGPPLKLRVAAVAVPDMINKFTEDTAVNRGADFLVTDDMYEAIRWLSDGD